jgi:hypothetical protein
MSRDGLPELSEFPGLLIRVELARIDVIRLPPPQADAR